MRLMRPILIAVVVIGAFFVMGILAESAQAAPQFARKYGTSCNTCHVAPPKLNGFGKAFRLNGYFWPGKDAKDDDAARKIKAFEIGKAHFKPTGGNRATIDQAPLIGFWSQIKLFYQPDPPNKSKPATTTADFSVDFMAAGTIGDSISYWTILPTDAGGNTSVEAMFIQFNDLGVKNLINIRAGQLMKGILTSHSADTLSYGKIHYNSMTIYSQRGEFSPWGINNGGSGADLWGFTSFGNSSVAYQLSLLTDFGGQVGDNNYQKTFGGYVEYQFGGVRYGDGGGKADGLMARVKGLFAYGVSNLSASTATPQNAKNSVFGGELEVGIAGFNLLALVTYHKQIQETGFAQGVYDATLANLYMGAEAHYELAGGSIIPVIRWEKSSPKVTGWGGIGYKSQGRHFLDLTVVFQVRPNVQIKPGVILELNSSDVNNWDNTTVGGVNKGAHKTLSNIGLWMTYGY